MNISRLASKFLALAALLAVSQGQVSHVEPLPKLPSARSVSYSSPPVVGFGGVSLFAADQPVAPKSLVVAMATTPDGKGYWLVTATGEVFCYGDAVNYGSAAGTQLYAPIVGIAATPDGKGYWLVAADGGIFTFGDATFYGSMGGKYLAGPIVGMAATPDGKGYWLVATDGGIFTFGDATFYGSMGGKYLAGAVVAMAATPDGKGYWLVAADGGIFTFGDATFYGSMGGKSLNASVVGMASAPDGRGYWLVAADGGIFTFGDATFYGSMGGEVPSVPISAVVASPSGSGYYLLSPDSFDYNFQPNAGERVIQQSSAIVLAAESQIGPTSSPGSFCNPYGPCEEWCSLFAGWTWTRAGIPAPTDGFTGALYDWVAAHQRVLAPNDVPAEGDFVFYGTGQQSASTSVHMGVVVQAWGDGSLLTIEGDSGPGDPGYLGVTVNGPFLASHSLEYNGAPIYGFGEPLQ